MFDDADARVAKLNVGGGIVRVGEGETLTKGKNAVLVYLMADDMDEILGLMEKEGGKVVMGKMPEGGYGFLAKFEDTKGIGGGFPG